MSNKVAHDAQNVLVPDLRQTHADNLVAVVLYGAAAGGDQVVSHADYNILVVLRRLAPEDLRLAQAPTREWQRLGHPLPVYFTSDELRDAADVFPIEFTNMRRARLVLFGVDPFAGVEISNEHLRHQTEYELRSKLIQLRRIYVAASASVERLQGLMTDSLPSFIKLFAPALALRGIEPPAAQTDVVRETAREFKLDGTPFEQIYSLRVAGTREQLDETRANTLFANYLREIERLIVAIDEPAASVAAKV